MYLLKLINILTRIMYSTNFKKILVSNINQPIKVQHLKNREDPVLCWIYCSCHYLFLFSSLAIALHVLCSPTLYVVWCGSNYSAFSEHNHVRDTLNHFNTTHLCAVHILSHGSQKMCSTGVVRICTTWRCWQSNEPGLYDVQTMPAARWECKNYEGRAHYSRWECCLFWPNNQNELFFCLYSKQNSNLLVLH